MKNPESMRPTPLSLTPIIRSSNEIVFQAATQVIREEKRNLLNKESRQLVIRAMHFISEK